MVKFFRKVKKSITTILVIILLFVGIVIVPMYVETLNSAFMISKYTDSAPKLVAHRGLSSLYPENTLVAFEGAAEYGFDAFEFDIHTTKDGKWVVIHDDDVDNVTDSTGQVEDYTLKELHEMKLTSGSYIENYEDLIMPTLSETLDICIKTNIIPVIEIKKCDIAFLPSLKELLDKYGLSDTAIIISFDKEYLEAYREIDKDIEMLYLSNKPTKEDIDWCVENNFGINFNMWLLYQSIGAIRYAKDKDITIAAWTVDNTLFADIMVMFGAKYITTNKILP